jgi:hypothetical protein
MAISQTIARPTLRGEREKKTPQTERLTGGLRAESGIPDLSSRGWGTDMSKSTPGPWAYDGGINRVYSTATNQCVAAIHIAGNPACEDAWPADARLIAAAPELLALAHEYRRAVEYYIAADMKSGDREGARMKTITLNMIDATIAKAEGRA